MLILAVPLGLVIGLSLGALGGGGSILTVPALVYVLGQSPHGATTASLLIVGITALVGMAAHLKLGRVQVSLGILFGLLGAGGSYVGSRLSASVDPNVLLAAFSALIMAAAITMLRRGHRTRVPAVPVVASSSVRESRVVAAADGSTGASAGPDPDTTAVTVARERQGTLSRLGYRLFEWWSRRQWSACSRVSSGWAAASLSCQLWSSPSVSTWPRQLEPRFWS